VDFPADISPLAKRRKRPKDSWKGEIMIKRMGTGNVYRRAQRPSGLRENWEPRGKSCSQAMKRPAHGEDFIKP